MELDAGVIVGGIISAIVLAVLFGIWKSIKAIHQEVTVEHPIWRAHVDSRLDHGDERMGRIEKATEAAAGEAHAARNEAYQCRVDILTHTGSEERIADGLRTDVTGALDNLAQAIRDGDPVGRAAE